MRSNQLGFNMDQYLNLKIGAKRRLEILRKSAKSGQWIRPMTWRDCRFASFRTASGLDWCGKHWVTFDNPFSRQRYADIAYSGIKHTGWYTDSECNGKSRGVIVPLPHGRFIAGYEWSDNGESVYYPEIYTDIERAARSADYHAEKFAEAQNEDNARFNECQRLETLIEDSLQRRAECLLLARINHNRDAMRDEARDLKETIIEARETIAREYSEY